MSALAGRRIVITRAAHQAPELAARLEREGAVPIYYPCIAIVPPEDTAALDDALMQAARGEFDWLVLTSANTVVALAQRCRALGVGTFPGARVAAVGPATADAAREQLGLTVEVMPDDYVAEALAAAINPVPSARVFLPQSDIADGTLSEALRACGALVTCVDAYRTVRGSGGADVPALLRAHFVDAITFTSASTVEHFAARLSAEGGDSRFMEFVPVVCIGPKAAAAARAYEFPLVLEAPVHTLDGLLDLMRAQFARRNQE